MKKGVISRWWKNYKYRFVPWLALNVKHHEQSQEQRIHKKPSIGVHHLKKSEEILITDTNLAKRLSEYFAKCQKNMGTNYKSISTHNRKQMLDHFGFVVERKKSSVSGTGVFVTEGVAPTGAVVALYCGTIYNPYEPLFFPSIGNKYIFRCVDGLHIDGNDKWISKSIFKSCASRDQLDWDTPCCDTTWLTEYPTSPLNIGQYVNNRSGSGGNNVIYQECNLTCEGNYRLANSNKGNKSNYPKFPREYFRFLPNLWNDPGVNCLISLRLVPLVAVKPIYAGEEVLSSYFTVVHPDNESVKS